MYKSSFGTHGQIQFRNENEYYILLGYLAKSDGTTSLAWEHNEEQGAWGSEGRIKFYISNPPLNCKLLHTAGTGKIVTRVNCNEYVEHIVKNHKFVMGNAQDIADIRETVPEQFRSDYQHGLDL